jgi:formate hydrogenlyase subunit 6/NADH:ubiquinone oxidoreductase subunit I
LIPARDFELACYSREEMVYHLDDLMRLGGEFSEEPEAEDNSTTQEETQL